MGNIALYVRHQIRGCLEHLDPGLHITQNAFRFFDQLNRESNIPC